MARLPRIVIPNQPIHIIHRGNNRQDIFESEEDLTRIKEDIATSLSKTKCHLHAYVIMTNHLHLLITPEDKAQLTKFMQSMANRYVRYFNAKHQRTGTLWEGRYKSCLVDSEHYLFALYQYVEMNPFKAGMVEEIADYPWSSYHHNALGEIDPLISEHELYENLGVSRERRCEAYLEMFDRLNTTKQDSQITNATLRGEALGDDTFHQQISALISRPTKLTAHGGDRKSEAYYQAD